MQQDILVRMTSAAVSGVAAEALKRHELIRRGEYSDEVQNDQLGYLTWVVGVLAQLRSVFGPDDRENTIGENVSARKHIAFVMNWVVSQVSQIDGVCLEQAYQNMDPNMFMFNSADSVTVNDKYGLVRVYGHKVDNKNVIRAAFHHRVEIHGVDIAVVMTVTCDCNDVDTVAALLSKPNISVPYDRDLLYKGPFLGKISPYSIGDLSDDGDFDVVVGVDGRDFVLYFFEKVIRNRSGYAALMRAAHNGGITVMAIVC